MHATLACKLFFQALCERVLVLHCISHRYSGVICRDRVLYLQKAVVSRCSVEIQCHGIALVVVQATLSVSEFAIKVQFIARSVGSN